MSTLAAGGCKCGRGLLDEGTCVFCGHGNAREHYGPRPVKPTPLRDTRPWTPLMVAAAISRWNTDHDRPPVMTEWDQAGPWWPSAFIVRRVYGTWNNAIRSAGLEPSPRGRPANTRPEQDAA
jgi:hypothetical protein